MNNVLKNIKYQTALLESVNWDEAELRKLYEYLDTVFANDVNVPHPKEVLKNVNEFFTEEAANALERIFKEVAITTNLHLQTKGQYNEH